MYNYYRQPLKAYCTLLFSTQFRSRSLSPHTPRPSFFGFPWYSLQRGNEIVFKISLSHFQRNKIYNKCLFEQIKKAGTAVNLVSATTDDAEKVFQEAIEQVTN